ncbi:MAG: EAL domain-containing protein [Planctomycetota bacterium]
MQPIYPSDPKTVLQKYISQALGETTPRASEDFCQAAGRVLALCGHALGADQAYVVETSDDAGRVLAGFGAGAVICSSDALQSAAAPVASLWESALINGAFTDDPQMIARPFSLDGRTVGVVLFCWDNARETDGAESQHDLVEVCAQWVSGEWSRRVERRRENTLNEHRYRAVVEGASDGLFEWDLISNEVSYSLRWKQMLGLDANEVMTAPDVWFNLVDSSDLAQLEADLAMCLAGQTASLRNQHRLVNAEGEHRWMLCRGELICDEDGTPLRLVGSLSDTTEFKMAEDKLRHAAEHDKLTDLPNRATVHARIEHAIRRHRLTGGRRRYAFMFLDFDRFKKINDSLGHDAGDQLLIQIAERLRGEVRLTDTAARIGGDEFVILLEEIESFEAVVRVADRLLEVFSRPFNIDGSEVTSTASIGIVDGGAGYESADDVIRDADSAMYHAKNLGKARYAIFDQDMQDESLKRLELERELRQAIGTDQMFMVYQPIVSVEDGTPCGFESLVRWEHPELGVVRPDHFIHVAEETGLIVPLGEFILDQACRDILRIREAMPELDLTMNVNLSRRQLVHPDIVDMICDTVAATGVAPSLIKLEITESVIMDANAAVLPVLEQLRERGFQLAMDDFGTGHSSLSNLHQFPIHVLKIDRSFVKSLDKHVEFAAVIQAIVTLAQTLGLSVVAEGIETMEQLAVLQALNCDQLQGYLFAQPLKIENALDFLRNPRPLRLSA